jgi:hypothetical protein
MRGNVRYYWLHHSSQRSDSYAPRS